MTRSTAALVRLTGGLLALAVVLTGCAGDSTDQSADFNDADIAFAQGMIPHHEGALMMSEVAVERATDPRVIELAQRIEAGQDPEIELMTGWLAQWGQPLESGDEHGMDHGSDGMGGMDTGGMDLDNMPSAGPEFDRMWLESMIEHHDGAVEMARTELDEGRNPEAIDLAHTIIDTQTREIEEMQQLLTELDG
jgi:uncharacterized protein (DUF305 family)